MVGEILANQIEQSPVQEKEIPIISIYFGLFFFNKKDMVIGLGLSRQYQVKSTDSLVKYYSLNIVSETIENGIYEAINHIKYILDGYSEYKGKIKLIFDIFGIQNGSLCGLCFSHLIQSDSVSGLEDCIGIISSETRNLVNSVKMEAFSTELNSFTFLYNENVDNPVEQDETSNNSYDNEEIIYQSDGTLLEGYIKEDAFLGSTISNQDSQQYISRDRSNFFTRIYTGWIINDMKARSWLDNVQENTSKTGLVMMFVPDCTFSKISGLALLGISVLANMGCAVISFELAALRFNIKTERDENLNQAKNYLLSILGDALGNFSGKIIGTTFKKGYQFRLKSNEIKLKDIQKQKNIVQKQVKGKKAKEAEGRYYERLKRKIKKENVRLSNAINDGIDQKVNDLINCIQMPSALLKEFCNLNWSIIPLK